MSPLIPQGFTPLRLSRLTDQHENKHTHLCADLVLINIIVTFFLIESETDYIITT